LFESEDKDLQNLLVLVPESQYFLNVIVGKEITKLKNNCIPKGLVPLEKFFDNNYVAKNLKVTPNDSEVEDRNIGIEEFSDVSAWSYDDMKVYDINTFQHTIPIRENEKSYRQKLRRINPFL
jgi:hypothetical protein